MDFKHTNYQIEDEYPKLVRDKIPEIIKEKGGIDIQQKTLANDAEFLGYLLQKMIEESVELKNSDVNNNLEEELADIFEIIDSILDLRGKTEENIRTIQKEKREKRGGFEKRILMLNKAK